MTALERIKNLLEMESRIPLKDDAGIYVPQGMDSAAKCKAYEECLRILKNDKK